MSHSFIRLGMSRPTVNTPEGVQGILQQHDVRPRLQVVLGNEVGTTVLAFVVYEHMLVSWPSAVRADELPVGTDDDEQDEAVDTLHENRGQQGLIDILLALTPYLNSPLVIQAATFSCSSTFFRAKEWTVRPGATEVEVKEIEAMDDEHSIVQMN